MPRSFAILLLTLAAGILIGASAILAKILILVGIGYLIIRLLSR